MSVKCFVFPFQLLGQTSEIGYMLNNVMFTSTLESSNVFKHQSTLFMQNEVDKSTSHFEGHKFCFVL